MYVCIYIYVCVCVCVCTPIYTYNKYDNNLYKIELKNQL